MDTDGERDEAPHGLEGHLAEYLKDPSLRPVAAVVVLIFATLGASLVANALLERNLFAMAGLALLVVTSGHALLVDLRARRFGFAAWGVVVFWIATLAVTWAFVRIGIF